MSLLSYAELLVMVATTDVISVVSPDMINASSIDITLGHLIMAEVPAGIRQVSLSHRRALTMDTVDMTNSHYALEPGEFILAHSQQIFNLPPNISAEYKLKSSMARIGLEHLNAGWCDAGWNGSVLTLELKNMTKYHTILIRPGDRIGQVVFYKHEPVPDDASYAKRGRYNNDITVTGAKK